MQRSSASVAFKVTVRRSSADFDRLRPQEEALRISVAALGKIATERMLAQRE